MIVCPQCGFEKMIPSNGSNGNQRQMDMKIRYYRKLHSKVCPFGNGEEPKTEPIIEKLPSTSNLGLRGQSDRDYMRSVGVNCSR